MKPLDTYLNLCTEVYELSKPTPPADAFTFYLEYVKQAQGPKLEPMCGTGRFLVPMLEMGFDIEGFDASSSMLAKLKEKSPKASVWQGFVQDLDRPTKYNLVFIPAGSFCLITDLDQVKLSLKKVYEHLNSGGIFVFEIEGPGSVTPPKQLGIWKGSSWFYPDGRFIMLSTVHLPLKNNIGTTICKYELVENNQIIQTEIEPFYLRFWDNDELTALLKSIGFTVRMFKTYDSNKQPGASDESIIFECRKR